MTNFTLVNEKFGGFRFITKIQALAWKQDPEKACEEDKGLLDEIFKQTHGQGFCYSNYKVYQRTNQHNICLKQR